MAENRVGTCSICGGSVTGVRGAWYSVSPPPPDKCSQCGAVARSDIIEMHPTPTRRIGRTSPLSSFARRAPDTDTKEQDDE